MSKAKINRKKLKLQKKTLAEREMTRVHTKRKQEQVIIQKER